MNKDRILHDLERLSRCSDRPGSADGSKSGTTSGVTRFSWSDADRQARSYIEAELRALGLCPWTDGIGNIRAEMPGRDRSRTLLLGSHFDSVKNGGAYDGIYGVVAALEVLRSLHEQDCVPPCSLGFIAFVEEEGSNFGCTCLGSKAVTGGISVQELCELQRPDGKKAGDILRGFGLTPEDLPGQQIDPAEVAAFLEVHIEQNSVLEKAGKSLGLVTAVFGMRLHEVVFTGRSDHAASPMQGRADAMAGFAEAAHRLEQCCLRGEYGQDFSCTVGRVDCEPGVGIVIADRVRFTVDIRHVDPQTLDAGWERMTALLRETAEKRGLGLTITRLSASGGVRMDAALMEKLRNSATVLGEEPLLLPSGPAHDAAALGAKVPVAMLFVPSKNGLSHCPQEYTEAEHLCLGAQVLEETVKSF
ncbi:Zn-dependent hydrolase [Desulfovibrio sp. OttesenSCG-928-G15]|nr:Zn-dependent hydrolase [Desulfovibrio sp. OttesenSCG-928-G15]